MAEDRRAGVLFVLSLDAEAIGKKGVASGGINQKTCLPGLCGPILQFQRDDSVFAI